MTFTLFIFIIAYTLTGMFVAKSWYQQRHGIHFKLINGGADAIFSSVFVMSFVWPLILIVPSLRNPKLCRHPSHVLARDEARQRYEQYQAAAARDDQHRG